MAHRRSRVSGYTSTNWRPAANACRDAITEAEKAPAMTSLETSMWNAAQAAIDALMAAIAVPPLGGNPWYEIDLDIGTDSQVRSIAVNVTYRT